VQIGAADSSPLYSEQHFIRAFQARFLHLLDRPPPGAQEYDSLHDAVMLPHSKIGRVTSGRRLSFPPFFRSPIPSLLLT
jgi:hypothetical protein